ncbi:MAG: hypothetical protein AAGA92_08085 [Planctomycetota bacterium]
MLVLAAGCGTENSTKLDDYLETLEFGKPTERMLEIGLGEFRVPITLSSGRASAEGNGAGWFELRFHMFLVVPPASEKTVLGVIEEHRGVLRDTIYTACRTTSLDELSDPRWTTLKAKLADAVRPVFGEQHVRQILLVDATSETL